LLFQSRGAVTRSKEKLIGDEQIAKAFETPVQQQNSTIKKMITATGGPAEKPRRARVRRDSHDQRAEAAADLNKKINDEYEETQQQRNKEKDIDNLIKQKSEIEKWSKFFSL
jgi:hypothetical protein